MFSRGRIIPFAIGVGFMLLLHLFFVTTWQSTYSKSPWPGYQQAMASGFVEPFFNNSPLALKTTLLALLLLGLFVGLLSKRTFLSGAISSIGVLVSACFLAFTLRGYRESNLAPLTPIVFAIETLPPIALGVVIAAAIKGLRHRLVH